MRSVALLCITPFTHPTESWCSYVCRKGCYSAEDYRRLPHQRLRLVGHTRECGWSPWWWLTQSFDTRESSGIANQSSHYALTSPLMDLWSGFSFRPWQWAAIACSCSVLFNTREVFTCWQVNSMFRGGLYSQQQRDVFRGCYGIHSIHLVLPKRKMVG